MEALEQSEAKKQLAKPTEMGLGGGGGFLIIADLEKFKQVTGCDDLEDLFNQIEEEDYRRRELVGVNGDFARTRPVRKY